MQIIWIFITMLKAKVLHPFSAHKVINNTLYVPSPLNLVLIPPQAPFLQMVQTWSTWRSSSTTQTPKSPGFLVSSHYHQHAPASTHPQPWYHPIILHLLNYHLMKPYPSSHHSFILTLQLIFPSLLELSPCSFHSIIWVWIIPSPLSL